MYYEDIEFSLRAKNNGIKLNVNQKSIIYNNVNYKKYTYELNQLIKVYSVINRLRLGKTYFKNSNN